MTAVHFSWALLPFLNGCAIPALSQGVRLEGKNSRRAASPLHSPSTPWAAEWAGQSPTGLKGQSSQPVELWWHRQLVPLTGQWPASSSLSFFSLLEMLNTCLNFPLVWCELQLLANLWPDSEWNTSVIIIEQYVLYNAQISQRKHLKLTKLHA